MKKFRLLAAVVVAMALMFTVALAADYSVVKDAVNYEINYETGDLTLTVISNVAYEVDSPGVSVDFDKSAWTIKGNPTSAVGTAATNASTGLPGMSKLDYHTLATGDVLLEVVFSPVEGGTQAGSQFKITSWWYETAGYAEEKATYTYTVKAAEEEEEIIPSTASITSEMKTIVVDEVSYNNVWVGAIKVVLGTDNATGVKAVYNTNKETATYAVDGEGEVKATIAIVGAPADAAVEAVLVY